MKEYFRTILLETGTFTMKDIILHIAVAAILGGVVYLSYWYTHSGTNYSKKFNVTLITLAVLTATVMTVIGNNVALSLGMVGALSIVRFRTAIKDSRDTTYIFWTIIIGICCGVGDYLVAVIGSGIVFVVLLFLGRVRNDDRILLIVRAENTKELDIEGEISRYFNHKPVLKVKNTTPSSVELIYELTYKTYIDSYKKEHSILDILYQSGKVEYVNFVSQSDEISG